MKNSRLMIALLITVCLLTAPAMLAAEKGPERTPASVVEGPLSLLSQLWEWVLGKTSDPDPGSTDFGPFADPYVQNGSSPDPDSTDFSPLIDPNSSNEDPGSMDFSPLIDPNS